MPARQLHLLPALVCLVVLSACGKKDDAPAAVEPKVPEVSEITLDAEISRMLAPEPAPPALPGSAPEAAGNALDDQVDDIRRKYPNKNATELLNVPEVNERLREGLQELAENPKLRAQIDSSVEVAAAFIGLDGAPGSHKLNLDLNGYSSERTDRMLKAVLQGNGKSLVDFVVGEIGEAAPDLSYGSAQRAPNGVAIDTVPPPAAQPSDND